VTPAQAGGESATRATNFLSSIITHKLIYNLSTSFQLIYDNRPVAGYRPTDIYFMSSFVVKM
jgi:hypothetical protein